MLPIEYRWLQKEPAPKLLRAALADFGVHETPGSASNPVIMGWAQQVGVADVYTGDATAWCGLAMAHWCIEAGYQPPAKPLWALNWQTWGTPADQPSLGDVLVFERPLPGGGRAGHVGLYVAETADRFVVLAGNQDDQVCIRSILKSRLVAARRSPWRTAQPANVRPISLGGAGTSSTHEA